MKTLLVLATGLALLTGTAQAQAGQFQPVYQDDELALQARYTLTLGAQPQSQFSMRLAQNQWDGTQLELTLFDYGRDGFTPVGLSQSEWHRLTLDEGENTTGGSSRGAIIVGAGLAIVVGGAIFIRELEDGVEDTVACAFGQDCKQ